MVYSTWMGLNTAVRGLQAAQRGLDVTGHNITNAGTPGFTRQRANVIPAPALAYPGFNAIPGQIGQGPIVTSISRLRDEFLDSIYRRQSSALETVTSQTLVFSQLETLLNEPTDTGIGTLLGEFFSGWNNVANTPESRPARTQLITNTESLLRTFRDVAAQIDRLRRDQDVLIEGRVREANGLIDQIADLNRQIAAVEASGQQANDLADRRDLLIDDLAKILPVQAVPAGNGQVDVQLTGIKIVSKTRGLHLETLPNPDDPSLGPTLRIRETRSSVPLPEGQLRGFLTLRDEVLPRIAGRLNELASALVNRVNYTHRKHYGLDGVNGRPFFQEIITQRRTSSVDLAAAFPALGVGPETRIGTLGITAGTFEVQGRSFQLNDADVDPNEGITLRELLERVNQGQSQVRAVISDDFAGQFVRFDLYNPPGKETEIAVRNGTSNALTVLGMTTPGVANVDTLARATYRGAMIETTLYGPLLEDTGLIAAAGELIPGEFAGVGDNQGALAIADLDDRLDLFSDGGSFAGFFNTTVSLLGTLSQANQRAVQNQTALTDQANTLRQSVSAVNLDEEAVELIKFQKAYEASARIVTTLQGIYDTILGLIR